MKGLAKKSIDAPLYRIISVELNDDNEYIAHIQMINKSYVLKMHPEDILSDDKLTDSFSQRDIRTLKTQEL